MGLQKIPWNPFCGIVGVDPDKPPVIVVDPRAGHGPGIGGFKRDSEVGMATREGHPVYFVIFFPEPTLGQTLADVLHVLRRFAEEVAQRHPGNPPVLYGNCQAGWALTLLSADCAGLVGPVVLNGSPLSYWAGESGVNPMRLSGGLLGGSWLAHLTADLGNGRFDGAWLAQNFENLKPEKAVWEKYAQLFTNVDSEQARFLEFERWWNGFYFLSREEILAIVENLFIGNQLEQGLFQICQGCTADLRRIRNPIVIFASYGDNITPPHQALGWIPAVYKDTEDLKQAGQRIVYLTNPHVGHLGIFVSAGVARLEHRAILESLAEIEALAPGLYEMKIDNPSGDPDCHKPTYSIRFEPRQVEDLKTDYPQEAFERVKQVSTFNEALYRAFVSPWAQALSTPWTAQMLKWLHPRIAMVDCTPDSGAMVSLREIQKAGRRARDLVRQILTFSRNEPPRLNAVDLAEALHDTERLLRVTMPPTVALQIHIAPHLPTVLADATQVEQALLNLCTNAIHAIGTAKGTVRVDALPLRPDTALCDRLGLPAGDYVAISVHDNGPGMDAATLQRVFEPFFTTKPVGQRIGNSTA